jgi:hypothetical protein
MKRTFCTGALVATALLAACGGGAFDNATDISNSAGTPGQKLSFAYFQRCVAPLLNTPLPIVASSNNSTTTNTCAASGCHDNTQGTGGALRLFGSASVVDLALPAATLRASDMFKNYTSASGESVAGAPDQSRLLNKPLVRGVLHGGGLVIASAQDPAARRISYWISHPMPQGQDEFSSAAAALFTPADLSTGTCNSD